MFLVKVGILGDGILKSPKPVYFRLEKRRSHVLFLTLLVLYL